MPLARWRARGQVNELRHNDLRFTNEETVHFLTDIMALDLAPGDITALERRTEGWIAGRETFRSGTQGAVWANTLLVHPWGSPLEEIKVPVTIWHGEEDTNAPVVMAEYLAQAIPGSRLQIMTNKGHLSSLTYHLEEILTYLASP